MTSLDLPERTQPLWQVEVWEVKELLGCGLGRGQRAMPSSNSVPAALDLIMSECEGGGSLILSPNLGSQSVP